MKTTKNGNETKTTIHRMRPECQLIGQNGNIFNLIGIASETLKHHGLRNEAAEMGERVLESGSYYEALGIIGEYVDVI